MSLSSRNSLSIAFLVAGAFFMENLDGTVIATALPQMAKSFNASPVSLNVGMTAYMLTLAVFIPISGWVFVLISVVALISVADFLKLDADAGAIVSGHLRSFDKG
jgi:MFS family permease